MGIVHAKEKFNYDGPPKDTFKYGIPKQEMDYEDCDEGESRTIKLDGLKARVDRVHINGLARTKDDIIQDTVQELFTAQDLEDVLLKAHNVKSKLEGLGCFRHIAVFIDTSKGDKATPDGLEVTYHVKELRRVVGGINTQIGENEGSLVLGIRAPNLFGRGERLQSEYSYGTKHSNNFNLAFIKPFTGRHSPLLSASVYQTGGEWPVSGYKEVVKGVTLDFGFKSLPYIKHNFQWNVSTRELNVISRSTSFDVREEAGVTLKSALKHILSIDLRDEQIFPSCGSLSQFTSEFAGVGGNVGYVKNEAYFQTNYSILDNIVLQASLAGGIMNTLKNDSVVTLSDMYYLGGPSSLRGFQIRGVGPHSEGDSVGSHWFWACGLHLYTPLPFRPGKGGLGELFRTHFFVNAGNADKLADGEERSIAEIISQNVRISYGVGLAVRLGQMARVELNYCFPHQFDGSDVTQPGVQFGIGVQFL